MNEYKLYNQYEYKYNDDFILVKQCEKCGWVVIEKHHKECPVCGKQVKDKE